MRSLEMDAKTNKTIAFIVGYARMHIALAKDAKDVYAHAHNRVANNVNKPTNKRKNNENLAYNVSNIGLIILFFSSRSSRTYSNERQLAHANGTPIQ